MQARRQLPARSGQDTAYEIKVKGVVGERWSDWFNGLTLSLERPAAGAPVTTLRGLVPDQAALRGIVNKLWDLNLTLISIRSLETEARPEASHDS